MSTKDKVHKILDYLSLTEYRIFMADHTSITLKKENSLWKLNRSRYNLHGDYDTPVWENDVDQEYKLIYCELEKKIRAVLLDEVLDNLSRAKLGFTLSRSEIDE